MATPPITYVARLFHSITNAGVAIVSVNSNGIVDPSNLQAAAQATIDAFDDSNNAQVAFENLQARTSADALIDLDKSSLLKIARAEAAVSVDEINLIREWIVSFKAATAAATSLANLQSRVAALPDMPDRTLAQFKTAIKNKIDSGTVD